MKDKPTENEVREFWEWCGFKVALGKLYWYPNKEPTPAKRLPLIDLNNLFKYAVPKLLGDYYIDIKDYKLGWAVSIGDKLGNRWECDNKDLALALFRAIWEVIYER